MVFHKIVYYENASARIVNPSDQETVGPHLTVGVVLLCRGFLPRGFDLQEQHPALVTHQPVGDGCVPGRSEFETNAPETFGVFLQPAFDFRFTNWGSHVTNCSI